MSHARHRLSGRITVPLPPAEAFTLFTPRGEERWVKGWQPRFPSGGTDDTEPGTVFETGTGDETTTWVVIARDPGHRVSYARTTPGSRAGTVTVSLKPAEEGTEVEVAYDLTALTPEAEAGLAEFATGYPAFLQSWEEAIKAVL
ncbi:SRPBCC family protein [Spirillospora sp. CA-294931]|uniref:SRPBCC family protein n=1 Tax=Spirillospora sp. CA-294931 TaxID=3240042 RepID=UPI003D9364BC